MQCCRLILSPPAWELDEHPFSASALNEYIDAMLQLQYQRLFIYYMPDSLLAHCLLLSSYFALNV